MEKTLASLTTLSVLALAACSSDAGAPSDPAGATADAATTSAASATSSAAPSSTTSDDASATSAAPAESPHDDAPAVAPTSVAVADATPEGYAPVDGAASAGESNSEYTATINGANVTIPNAAATCSHAEGTTHFNVSNANDPTSPIMDIMLGADQKVVAIAYATGTDITLMSDPAHTDAYQVQVEGSNYTVSGTGVAGDFTTPVPFEIKFTCNG